MRWSFLENTDPSIPVAEGDPNVAHLFEPVHEGKQLSILIPLVKLDKSKIDEICLCMYACLVSQCQVPMGRTYADCIILLWILVYLHSF
jgi:hypothetical protein